MLMMHEIGVSIPKIVPLINIVEHAEFAVIIFEKKENPRLKKKKIDLLIKH